MKKTKVILDSNFLMLPVQFKVDIFDELEKVLDSPFELVTITPVVSELGKISEKSGKDSQAARIAIQLVRRHKIKILDVQGGTDAAILKIANENTIVCTQDKKLQERLKREKIKTVFLRQRRYLKFA